MTAIPCLIRGACSKQTSLNLCMDLLNNSFKQIQPMSPTNVSDLHLKKKLINHCDFYLI